MCKFAVSFGSALLTLCCLPGLSAAGALPVSGKRARSHAEAGVQHASGVDAPAPHWLKDAHAVIHRSGCHSTSSS